MSITDEPEPNNGTVGVSNVQISITVVVPCRNERAHIESCVESILAQHQVPGGYEIVVVDGMSTDGTREILKTLIQRRTCLRMLDNVRMVTPCALNIGIRAARGKWVAIMGAHNRYANDYLYQCYSVATKVTAENVGGIMYSEGNTLIQRAIAACHHSPFACGGASWHDTEFEGAVDTVFGGFYRREVFDQIGLFDEELIRNQDDELNLRLQRFGGKIWQSAKIKSWYTPRSNLAAVFRQYLQYGYWKVRVIQKHRIPASIRHLVPGAFVFAVIILAALSLAAVSGLTALSPMCWILAGLLGTYLLMTGAAAIVTARKFGWRLLPIIPPVIACYHFGYGLGFLRGVWDFLIRRRGASQWAVELTRGKF